MKNLKTMKIGEQFVDGNEKFMVISDQWDKYPKNGLCTVKCVSLETGETVRFGETDTGMRLIQIK